VLSRERCPVTARSDGTGGTGRPEREPSDMNIRTAPVAIQRPRARYRWVSEAITATLVSLNRAGSRHGERYC